MTSITPNRWDLSKTGPLIVLESEDLVVTLQISYRQDGVAQALVTKWEIDGDLTVEKMTGDLASWSRFWSAFLDQLPDSWQGPVAHCESMVKY